MQFDKQFSVRLLREAFRRAVMDTLFCAIETFSKFDANPLLGCDR